MRLIKPSFEILEQGLGLNGLYKHIERCGRLSYRSEDKITEESAEPFVNRMVNSKHGAVLEHGTVYLKLSDVWDNNKGWICPAKGKYTGDPYSKVNMKWETSSIYGRCLTYYITSNMRVLVENGWEEDLKYLCEPTEYHEPRISVKFICSRSISHELVRHRVFSFIQESQRYVGYNKSKFGGEVTFCIPYWVNNAELQKVKGTIINHDEYGDLIGEYYYHLTGKEAEYFKPEELTPEKNFIASLQVVEQLYLELLNQGCKPQEAREVLPNATKTEIIMTGFLSDWVGDEEKKKGFFPLRCDSTAHPDMRALAIPLKEEFIKRGWINKDIISKH